MKSVVIAGGGDVGFSLARAMSEEGHNVAVIEQDESTAQRLEGLDILVVQGNAASPSSLNKAYINSADFFIAVTASDEVNMAASAIARNRGARTLARINSDDYITHPVTDAELIDSGIQIAFCPDLIAATHMANILTLPVLFDSPMLSMEQIRIVENRVSRRSKVLGKEIRKIGLPRDVNLVSIFRNEEVLIPTGSLRIEANDRVIALLPDQNADKLSRELSNLLGTPRRISLKEKISRAMIVGGSRVGLHLARLLRDNDISVVIIDDDPDRCEVLAEKLEGVLVINGSPTDKDLLKDEGVSEADAFLAVTEKDEINILSSLLAKQYGAKKSIALIDKPSLKSTLEEMGIDLVISPRTVTLSTIMKYFHQEDFESLAVLSQGEAQVLEVRIRERSKVANRRIDTISGLKSKAMLAGAIIRGGSLIIPRGDTYIHPGDRLVLFTKSDHVRWIREHI